MDHHGIPDPATVPWRYRGTYTTNTAPDVVCGDYLPPIDWSAPDAPPIADILAEIDLPPTPKPETTMNHAITALQEALTSRRIAETINRTRGKIECADAYREQCENIIEGLAALQCFQSGHLTQPETFVGKIAAAINHHSLESGSDTPDFILAEYLRKCLWVFDQTMKQRTEWYAPKPAEDVVPPVEPDLGDHPITETPSQ